MWGIFPRRNFECWAVSSRLWHWTDHSWCLCSLIFLCSVAVCQVGAFSRAAPSIRGDPISCFLYRLFSPPSLHLAASPTHSLLWAAFGSWDSGQLQPFANSQGQVRLEEQTNSSLCQHGSSLSPSKTRLDLVTGVLTLYRKLSSQCYQIIKCAA